MSKVEELVEWVAFMLSSQYGRSSEWQKPYARVLVREMGEKFDLALIDRRNYNAFNKHEVPEGAELAMVVPLADKELNQ